MNLAEELAAIEKMTVGELHERYAEVFAETARSRDITSSGIPRIVIEFMVS